MEFKPTQNCREASSKGIDFSFQSGCSVCLHRIAGGMHEEEYQYNQCTEIKVLQMEEGVKVYYLNNGPEEVDRADRINE